MVTLAIMAVLAMVAVPMIQITVKREKEQELRIALREIREGLDAYKRAYDQGQISVGIGKSGYPERLEVLVSGVENVSSPGREKIYFMRRIPRDPFHRSDADRISAAETWGKRSYASPPDDPREGEDVFDVYSLSEEVGINRIPYAQW